MKEDFEINVNWEKILKIGFLVIIAYLFYLLYIYPLVYSPIFFGDVDGIYHTYSIKQTILNNGWIKASNYEILRQEDYLVTRPPGFHGLIAGLIKIFSDYTFNSPYWIVAASIALSALILCLYKKKYWMILLPFAILNYRTFFSYIQGQWPFVISTPVILLSIFAIEQKKIYSGLLTSLALLIHPLAGIPIFVFACSLILNNVLTKKNVDIKFYLKTLLIIIICCLPFFNTFINAVSFFGGRNYTGTGIQNPLKLVAPGYTDKFLNDFLNNYSILLFLLPLSLYYAFKNKKYTLLLWTVITHLLIILLNNQQTFRLLIIAPYTALLFLVDGVSVIKRYEKQVILALGLLLIFNLFFLGVKKEADNGIGFEVRSRLPLQDYYFFTNLSKIYHNEIFTSNSLLNNIGIYQLSLFTNNRFFSPILINNSIIQLFGYEDYDGLHNITKIVVYEDESIKILNVEVN